DLDGPGARAHAAPPRPGAVPARRESARARVARRVRHALPPRTPGRGNRRRGALRASLGDLGRGREPAARPEGAARAAARSLDSFGGAREGPERRLVHAVPRLEPGLPAAEAILVAHEEPEQH